MYRRRTAGRPEPRSPDDGFHGRRGLVAAAGQSASAAAAPQPDSLGPAPGRARQAWPPSRSAAAQPSPPAGGRGGAPASSPDSASRSEEHTSELQSLMRISYAVF